MAGLGNLCLQQIVLMGLNTVLEGKELGKL